jgi:chromosome segregation ATPase
MNVNNIARNNGEEFEHYVERQFKLQYNRELTNHIAFNDTLYDIKNKLCELNERLNKMTTLAEELGVEETTLAEVVPRLATEITSLQTSLTEKEASITQANSELAADSTKLAENNAELAAIRSVKESLGPVVEKAKSLVPAPAVTPPAETPPSETPEQPPVNPTPPVEQEHPAEPAPEVTPTPETPAA